MLRICIRWLSTGIAVGALLGCYTTEFTPAPASPAAYQSSGTITATGNDVGHAITRAREEAAARGCAAISWPLAAGAAEASEFGSPRTTLTVECLAPAAAPEPPAPCPPPVPCPPPAPCPEVAPAPPETPVEPAATPEPPAAATTATPDAVSTP